MKTLKNRLERLEVKTGRPEPYTISIHKRIIDMDGKVESETTRTIRAGGEVE